MGTGLAQVITFGSIALTVVSLAITIRAARSSLAYSRQDPESYTPAIWLVSFDGHESSRLTEGAAPAWSPDGGRIAYVCGARICVMDVDGSNQTGLTDADEGSHWNPAWSPDGSKIVFESQDGADSDIYVVNTDGSGLVRLAG